MACSAFEFVLREFGAMYGFTVDAVTLDRDVDTLLVKTSLGPVTIPGWHVRRVTTADDMTKYVKRIVDLLDASRR